MHGKSRLGRKFVENVATAPVDLLKIAAPTRAQWRCGEMSNKHLIGVCQIYLLSNLFCQICKFGKIWLH